MYAQSLNYGAGPRSMQGSMGRRQQSHSLDPQLLRNPNRAIGAVGAIGSIAGNANDAAFRYNGGLGAGFKPSISAKTAQAGPLAPINRDSSRFVNNDNGSNFNIGGSYNRAAPQCRPDGSTPVQFGLCQAIPSLKNNCGFTVVAPTAPQDRPRGESCGSYGSWSSHSWDSQHSQCFLVGAGAKLAATNDNKKKKTELCKHYVKTGKCPYMEKCHFAHGEADRVSFSNVDEMKMAGVIADPNNYMCRPCPIFVSTGSCPYVTRCKSLHDPNIKGDENSNPPWLEHCTKIKKKEPEIIPDRLYHNVINGIHQENPLVDPFVWHNCRPSSRAKGTNTNKGSLDANEKDAKLEWNDTYDLVCNLGSPIFAPKIENDSRSYASATAGHVGNKASANKKLSEPQKLCIVLSMHRESSVTFPNESLKPLFDHHLDFTYAPTHCLNGQPCMILQTRYFRLLDLNPKSGRILSAEDIVKEVSFAEYNSLRSISPNAVISVYEVVFDSKGKRSANMSIWFDVDITICSNNKAKKLSKKGEDHWQMDDKSGALFCMPKNDAFELTLPLIEPYVFMQPIEDSKDGLALVHSILEHRIGTILFSQGLRFKQFPYGKNELAHRLVDLEKNFYRMKEQVDRWIWPKTSDMSHICKTAEERNQTEYSPEVSSHHATLIQAIWKSFVANLKDGDFESSSNKKRLPIFHSIAKRKDNSAGIPHIHKKKWVKAPSCPAKPINALSEATYKELLEGHEGRWKIAIQSYKSKLELIRQTAILNNMSLAQ